MHKCKFEPAFHIEMNERELCLPGRFEVCARCEGHGTHLNPSMEGHGYSAEEFNEGFPDEEGPGGNPREEYFKRGGIYDVTCRDCKGNRVIVVLDEKRVPKALAKRIERQVQSQAADDRADAQTRRWESGEY